MNSQNEIEKKQLSIVFLCGARDFHAMDWYRSARKLLKGVHICILTDLICGENFKKLINDDDEVYRLLILDKFLFRNQGHKADIWRNILKFAVMPFQSALVKNFYKRHPNSIFWAHGMYYLKLASITKVPYIGTPQGSELLVRPYRSKAYKRFAERALKDAKFVTVDSVKMQESSQSLYNIKPFIVQNGVDIKTIRIARESVIDKERNTDFLSIRGFVPLYRERRIIEGRNASDKYRTTPIHFIYPFEDESYINEVRPLLNQKDRLLGRLGHDEMYRKLLDTKIVFSIPESDSSPRSVYEAIFLGCVVIIVENTYYNDLPECIQNRIILTDVEKKGWFREAVDMALQKYNESFQISNEVENLFDQEHSLITVYEMIKNACS